MSTCSSVTTNGLLSQNFTGSGGSSFYSCAFLSNYTQASKCCSPDKVNAFPDPCYSWCDLPASMNEEFDSDAVDYFQYMKGCLNATGEDIGPLWCHAQPHIVQSPTMTMSSQPTSTFDAAAFCATQSGQDAISGPVDPSPGCGILPNLTNSVMLVKCCQPAPAQYSVMHCYEYCTLPRGNGFRGVGNLTCDEALGSFKACLLQEGNNSQRVFDGVFCRVNGSEIDLKGTVFSTTKYLTGQAGQLVMDKVHVLILPLVAGLWLTYG
jgi:hypothetical protein